MSVQNGAFTRTNGFAGDDTRIHPRFHMQDNPPVDPVASEKAGRPIYCQPREMVELIIPGSLNMPDFYVTEEHKARWPEQYAAFKKGHTMSATGTPLEEWPRMTRNQIKELKHLDFETVEQIAGMSDTVCQRIGMGGMNLRELAKAFLDDAERNALAERLTAENERQKSDISELTHKVEELSTLLNSVHGQMQDLKNAPSAVASYIPGMHDPVEQAKVNPEAVTASSLDNVAPPRRRGRPPKNAVAA